MLAPLLLLPILYAITHWRNVRFGASARLEAHTHMYKYVQNTYIFSNCDEDDINLDEIHANVYVCVYVFDVNYFMS